jgi:hypothetical protein
VWAAIFDLAFPHHLPSSNNAIGEIMQEQAGDAATFEQQQLQGQETDDVLKKDKALTARRRLQADRPWWTSPKLPYQ